MSPFLIVGILIIYFIGLYVVAHYTSKGANENSFFVGNKNSNWLVVAYGMVGTSLSGVTFMSVPGQVNSRHFIYFSVVIGYFIGYFIVAYVLLPLYYKLQLTSIYNYLATRFDNTTYKTGALFFMLSRTLGATLRMYLVINVLQLFILNAWHVPFAVTTIIVLLMILAYTYQGGVKTIVWTDMLQTTFMIGALLACIGYLLNYMGFSLAEMIQSFEDKNYTEMFVTDPFSSKYFLKQIIGGAFVTIAMTGLDQEMMQKNISCKTLGEAQKNMVSFSFILLGINLIFLCLGGLLYLFAAKNNIAIPLLTDDLFPTLALNYMPPIISLLFIVGLISALFPSADGAITALTSSFCIDILGLPNNTKHTETKKSNIRKMVQLTILGIFFICILIFKWINQRAIIDLLLDIAGYTYGPLLGIFAFGIFTHKKLHHQWVPIVVILAPVLSFILSYFSKSNYLYHNYQIGIELLIINGLFTFVGLWIISKKLVIA
jgi:Na+/proline symporter